MVSTFDEQGNLQLQALEEVKERSFVPKTVGYRVFTVVNVVILLGFSVIIILPLLNVISLAFSETNAITSGKVGIWPVGWNLYTFKQVVTTGLFWRQYANTVVYTILYTVIAMFLTTTFAYAISRKGLKGKSGLTWVALFTMFFAPGIVPSYVLVNDVLGWHNTVMAMVVPGTISVFNLLIMKTSFENFPVELEEAAAVDGMTTYGVFVRIVLPLSKAILATMVLFYAVGQWNDWWKAFLYMDNQNMYPVTMYLRNLIAGASQQGVGGDPDATAQLAANVKSVAMVLIALPIICVYPFIQKYFVSGVMLGAVKA